MSEKEFWIQTYTGQKFNLLNPTPSTVNIVDIAHSLSNICRFNGHSSKMYSVSQHSLTVAMAMKKDGFSDKEALVGLMHDAHEAYIGDMMRPVKWALMDLFGFDINKFENPIKEAISIRFNVDIIAISDEVKKYDDAVLRTEVNSLFHRVIDNWTDSIKFRLKSSIKESLPPKECSDLFIHTFKRLGGKI